MLIRKRKRAIVLIDMPSTHSEKWDKSIKRKTTWKIRLAVFTVVASSAFFSMYFLTILIERLLN